MAISGRAKTKETPQEMQNQGFDEKYGIPAVVLAIEDASSTPNVLRRVQGDNQGNLITTARRVTLAFEYDPSNNPIYIGEATMGSGKDEAKWRIRKLTYSGSNLTDVQWADGDDKFDNVWDGRDGLNYS